MLEIVNANNKIVGCAPREQIHRQGLWHRTAHVWLILESERALVFQLRSMEKDIGAGLLDVSVGGHVDAGEEPREAALREMEEELGLVVAPDDLIPLGVRQTAMQFGELTDCEFQSIFAVRFGGGLRQLTPDAAEVSAVVPITVENGLRLFNGERQQPPGIAHTRGADGSWTEERISLRADAFIPCNDRYHYRAFVMARRLLNGEEHLVV